MMITIKEIFNYEELQALLNENMGNNETAILKYSPKCTISFVAVNVIQRWAKIKETEKELLVIKIDVINSRAVSNKVAEYYGIKHESPQLIWLTRVGEVKWHGSHHMITEIRLNNLIDE